jgi:hypothetical protein
MHAFPPVLMAHRGSSVVSCSVLGTSPGCATATTSLTGSLAP